GSYPLQDFKTLENVQVPVTKFLQWSEQCDDGLLYFLTPRGSPIKNQSGPVILNSRGELIWTRHFDNVGSEPYNFGVQSYQGEDHLTFWVGEDMVHGHGTGYNYILNSAYEVVDTIGTMDNSMPDLHEFSITDNATALVSVYDGVRRVQDSVYFWDCSIREIDLQTRQLRWEWRASDHVDAEETYQPIRTQGTPNKPFDWFHINSAQKDELGNYLFSSRYLHSVLYVDGRTKETIWRLGGKKNSFMDLSGGNATNFAYQHDARLHPTDTFPKLYRPPPERPGFTTKLLTFEVDKTQFFPMSDLDIEKVLANNGSDPNFTVRVVMSYENPTRIHSISQGNVQLIPQGRGEDPKVLVGYGHTAAWTEFAANGTVLCDVRFAANGYQDKHVLSYMSYRVHKLPWTGKPKWKPTVVVDADTLYVSWMGATDVGGWAVEFSSSGETAWWETLRVRKTRFEESIAIPDGVGIGRYIRVVALDEHGARMANGISNAVDR
ncbi:ASST-domain-containing protein, partial [Neohortaea acidophila]